MTLKELSQLYYLNREIENDRRRLEELEAKLASPSSPNLSGMPRSTTYGNKIESSVADIMDFKAIIAAKQQQCIYERSRLMRYISEINDSLTREIFIFSLCERSFVAPGCGKRRRKQHGRKRKADMQQIHQRPHRRVKRKLVTNVTNVSAII